VIFHRTTPEDKIIYGLSEYYTLKSFLLSTLISKKIVRIFRFLLCRRFKQLRQGGLCQLLIAPPLRRRIRDG
jgi:hypothetical protein